MKKEKNLENVNSKEKEKKEIPGIVKLLNAVELSLIVIPLVRLGLIIIFALLTMASGEVVNINEISQELFAGTKMINATIDDEDLTSLAMCLSCAGYIVNIKIINTDNIPNSKTTVTFNFVLFSKMFSSSAFCV